MELIALAVAVVLAAVILARRPPPQGDVRELAGRLAAEGQATRALHARIDQAAVSMAELAGRFEERRRLEEQAVDAVERVERLVAGSFSRGRAGENLLAAALGEFPPEMVLRGFAVGGRVCEFALRLPDGKLLPVDSKWTAHDSIPEWEEATDPARREEVRRRIERAVSLRLREAAGYIDPALTAPLAVVAVPDAVYACCRRAHVVAGQSRLVIVSYSLAVPYLLSLWLLYRTYAGEVDMKQVRPRLDDVATSLRELGERIEGKLSRGLTMAGNAAVEMRSLVAAAEASIGVISGGGPAGLPADAAPDAREAVSR